MAISRMTSGAESREEKNAEPVSWSPSTSPFCVDDAKFNIKKLYNRYINFHQDVTEFNLKHQRVSESKETNEQQLRSQQRGAEIAHSHSILGHIFNKFRLLYDKEDHLTYLRNSAGRYGTLIVARDIACVEAVTYLQARINDEINKIKNLTPIDEESLAKKNKTIENLMAQHRQLEHPLDLRIASVDYAKSIFDTNTQLYRKTALKVIEKYKKSLSPFNYYGRQRAAELEAILHSPNTLQSKDAVKNVIAAFIKDGKTPSDHKARNFFRSTSRASGIDDMSLRGMFIAEFMPHSYYRDISHNLRIVAIRQLIRMPVNDIVARLVQPAPAPIKKLKQIKPDTPTDSVEDQMLNAALIESIKDAKPEEEKAEKRTSGLSLTG